MNKYAQMDELPFLEVGELKLYPFAGDKLMTVRAELPKGSIAAKHSHPHEQMSFVAKGHVKVRMKGNKLFEINILDVIHRLKDCQAMFNMQQATHREVVILHHGTTLQDVIMICRTRIAHFHRRFLHRQGKKKFRIFS